ncbi:MAG: hypothetical protein EBX63_10150 [Betaproteobacteria bacterium]|nr:hypothetical protein [Betaproteobacteria bacterium]
MTYHLFVGQRPGYPGAEQDADKQIRYQRRLPDATQRDNGCCNSKHQTERKLEEAGVCILGHPPF